MTARLWSEDCLAAEPEVQRLRAELAARQAEGKCLADEVEARRASEALLAAALNRADAENERLREEVRRWSSAMSDRGEVLFAAQAERDRLRAALEPTAENLGALAMCTISFSRLDVDRILASLRARAGQP